MTDRDPEEGDASGTEPGGSSTADAPGVNSGGSTTADAPGVDSGGSSTADASETGTAEPSVTGSMAPTTADPDDRWSPGRRRSETDWSRSLTDGGTAGEVDGDDVPTRSGSPATVVLFMETGENRRLLAEWLANEYDVVESADPSVLDDSFDCCLVDGPTFVRYRDALAERTGGEDLAFLPCLLVARDDESIRGDPTVWDVVDDVVSVPVLQAELDARLENLLSRRADSLQLLDRERRLRNTLAELRVKERAMDAAPVGITITDPHQDDNPLVYVNEAFQQITGYDENEILGRNCRFLQGPETDPETVAEMRRGIDANEQVSVELVNYRVNGRRFWNRVDVAPVFDDGDLVNFVGFQTDVTDRTIRDQRLAVLNRVLRHNLRNDMSVVHGYAEQLLDRIDDPTDREYLSEIQSAARNLTELSDAVHDVETTLRGMRSVEDTVAVATALERIVESTDPDVEIELDLPDGPLPSIPSGVQAAFRRTVEKAVDLSRAGDRGPRVRARESPDRPGEVLVEVADRGAGISEAERRAVTTGEETPLDHPDGLDLWLVDWVTHIAGGSLEIVDADGPGSVVRFRIPGIDVEADPASE